MVEAICAGIVIGLGCVADLYVGFPAENPGPGAAYDRMFPFIFQKGAAVEMAIGTFAAYDEIYTGKIGSNSNWTMGTAIDVLKSSELENLAAATANALSGVTADREVLRSSVFDYDQRKVGSSYYVGYYDFVEMMEKLVVDIVFYREKIGIEETKEVLTTYLHRSDRNLNRLIRYAEMLKCGDVMKMYLEVLV